MGIYLKKVLVKDKKGNWNCQSCKTEKVSHSPKFWNGSKKAEVKSSPNERTYLNFRRSKSGNLQVSKATTYIGKNKKEVRELITSSNKLPKKYNGGRNGQ